ncbi:hypothetical protein [Glycomyces salinus]|uniref:hypothetical protein n=1 Tax=Glycomyces salinus TaxID=980294 RepID=UPI0018ECDC0D|nr:hypothetical protein [Glycomyces salinus]
MRAARGFLRPCFAVAGAAVVVAAVAGALLGGVDGATGAPAGVALAALGFTGSVWAIAGAEKIDIRLTLPVALVTYVFKLMLFAIVLGIVEASPWDALLPMGFGVIGGAIAWLATQAIWLYRAKIPYIELENGA